jgi:hypothetical protein
MPLSDTIERHKQSSARARTLDQISGWLLPPAKLMSHLLRRRSRSTLAEVIAAEPTDFDEAHAKTLYLMAILLSGNERLGKVQQEQIFTSFAPFRAELRASLMTYDSEDRAGPDLPSTGS